FVEDAGGGEGERSVDDVRVSGDPADVRHAPVDILGMKILVILGSAGDVGEISASAVLAALWFAGGAAGVHEEERGFRVLRDGRDDVVPIVGENFIDEKIAAHDHG